MVVVDTYSFDHEVPFHSGWKRFCKVPFSSDFLTECEEWIDAHFDHSKPDRYEIHESQLDYYTLSYPLRLELESA